MIPTGTLVDTLNEYLQRYPQDAPTLQDLNTLLSVSPDPTHRSEHRGHITCSGALVTGDRAVLLIHHAALGKWLFPGGHIEPRDHSLEDAVLREIEEEVRVPRAGLRPIGHDRNPFDIDRHPIPASTRRGEPAHEHWDFRFAFWTPATVQPRVTAEATAFRFVRLDHGGSRCHTRLIELVNRSDC